MGPPRAAKSQKQVTQMMKNGQRKIVPKKAKAQRFAGLQSFLEAYLVSLPGVAVNSFGLAMGLAARLAKLGAVAAAP